MEVLDETDREILDLLVVDASRSIAEIARLLHMPRPTVQYRVQKMRESFARSGRSPTTRSSAVR